MSALEPGLPDNLTKASALAILQDAVLRLRYWKHKKTLDYCVTGNLFYSLAELKLVVEECWNAAVSEYQAKLQRTDPVYKYEEHRPRLLTEEGQAALCKMRDFIDTHLNQSGAIRASELLESAQQCCGDSWLLCACVDYLVEQKVLKDVRAEPETFQSRVFVGQF